MKRMFTTSALALTIACGSSALAFGPEHAKHQDGISDSPETMAEETKAAPKLEDFVGEIELPELIVGSKAPELAIAKFVKGDSVDGFDAGQVYVVEFWATWCGPCIAAFPHLSELQEEHGEAVRFIGVNVWEGVDDQAERITKVEEFVEDQGERMSYTVAVEAGSAMADNWMTPAGQNGIPAAFIVDGTGHVAWIGHPGGIDEPLAEVVAGDFDATTAMQDSKDRALMMAGFNFFAESVQSGTKLDDARQVADILINQYLTDEPAGLNAIAWMLLTAKSENIGEADFKVAHRAIALACEKTEWKDWSLLDTYALAAFKTGHKDEAIKWQKKAIELAPSDNKDAVDELEGRLAQFETED